MKNKIVDIQSFVLCKACGGTAMRIFAEKNGVDKYECKRCRLKFMIIKQMVKRD